MVMSVRMRWPMMPGPTDPTWRVVPNLSPALRRPPRGPAAPSCPADRPRDLHEVNIKDLGYQINANLAAAGHDLRLVLRKLALLFARIPGAVGRTPGPGGPNLGPRHRTGGVCRSLVRTRPARRRNGLGFFSGRTANDLWYNTKER